jgi:hypothetical protein
LDSDDYFLPNLLENLYKSNFRDFDLICWSAWKELGGKRNIWKPRKLESIYNGVTASFLAGTVCYKKRELVKAGYFDPNLTYGENYELGLRLTQMKPNILLIDQPYSVISQRIRGEESLKDRLHSCMYQYKKHSDLFKKNGKSMSEMLYLIAWLLEKLQITEMAGAYYRKSWQVYNWNYKAFIKLCMYKVFKFS